MRNGEDGYMVITPLERKDGSTILINRGWISKKHRSQKTRPDSLIQGTITVEGLLREPWQKNRFTPDNRPERGDFYFPDVHQMAALTGSQPVWVEATMGKCTLFHHDSSSTDLCRPPMFSKAFQNKSQVSILKASQKILRLSRVVQISRPL
jgi:cytochrome oxidase assembly protein ShyY1